MIMTRVCVFRDFRVTGGYVVVHEREGKEAVVSFALREAGGFARKEATATDGASPCHHIELWQSSKSNPGEVCSDGAVA